MKALPWQSGCPLYCCNEPLERTPIGSKEDWCSRRALIVALSGAFTARIPLLWLFLGAFTTKGSSSTASL